MLANWLRQRVLAPTSGDIALGAAVDGFIACSNVFLNDGIVFYSIEDGTNREAGKGTYVQASNSIVRDEVFETLIAGVYSNNVATPMTITNESLFSVTGTVQGLTTHALLWKDMLGDFTHNPSTGYLTPDVKTLAGTVETYMFGDSLVESVGVRFAIPHDVSVGKAMFPHIRWSPNTASAGTVRWGIEFMIAERDTGVFKDSVTIYLEEAGSGTLDKLQIVEASVQLTATEPDTLIIGRVFRDSSHVNDTFVGDAALHVACIHYQTDAIGTPSKDPDFYTWS